MQGTSPSWVPTVSPPTLKLQTLKAKISTLSPKQTQNHSYCDDGEADDGDHSARALKFPIPPASVSSITSTSNPFVKHCVKLSHSSSYRHSHGSTLVVGTTPIREIYKFQESLKERTIEMDCLFLLDKAEIPKGLENSSMRTLRVSALVMRKLSQLQSTESTEAIALMKFPTSYFVVNKNKKDADCRKWFPSPHRILVLEEIQDPGNLGTLLRSAVAFRWHFGMEGLMLFSDDQQGGVFLLPGCCDPFSGRALRASRGAAFQLPIVSGTWDQLQALKDEFKMKMLAGHPEINDESKCLSQLSSGLASSLADVPLCLVLGNEAHGISEKCEKECDLVSIPMAGEFESLNVAVAGGIFLYMLQPQNHR